MDYALIGKIEKSKIYAEEKHRIQFNTFNVTIKGDNDEHVVAYDDGNWSCDCGFFRTRGVCTHTMTIERVLGESLPTLSG